MKRIYKYTKLNTELNNLVYNCTDKQTILRPGVFWGHRLVHINSFAYSEAARSCYISYSDGSETSSAKVKLSLCLTKHHTMMTYWGLEVQLHAGAWWRWVVRFTPLPLCSQGKSLRYPLD